MMRASLPFRVSVMSVLVAAGAAVPGAQADATYGPGSYAVPGQLPYGVYTANADMRDFEPGCSYSTWTSDGKPIQGDTAQPGKTLVANLSAPPVAKFITHGCTPWTKAN